MGHHVIKMPDIGEGIAEVELIAWQVQVGGKVAEDQVIAEVMTDKAMAEIPAPVAGTVVSFGGQPGQRMAVGSELIRLEVEGPGNVGAEPAAPVSVPAPAKPVAAAPVAAPEPVPAARVEKSAAAATPAAAPAPLASANRDYPATA